MSDSPIKDVHRKELDACKERIFDYTGIERFFSATTSIKNEDEKRYDSPCSQEDCKQAKAESCISDVGGVKRDQSIWFGDVRFIVTWWNGVFEKVGEKPSVTPFPAVIELREVVSGE